MKTKEELNQIRNEYEAACKELANADQAEMKIKAQAIDEKLAELNEDELKEVVAGTAFTCGTYSFSIFIHANCGGNILHVGNPFASCYCDKCGETHYWLYSFDYIEEYIKD